MHGLRAFGTLAALVSLATSIAHGATPWNIRDSKIAVIVYTEAEATKPYEKTTHVRFESILVDNGVTVLDKQKAEELKDVWNKLEDPGYFVTAEDFVENAGKYDLDGVLRVNLQAEVIPGIAGFSTATAHVDVRLVGKEANVAALTSSPMGVPGAPASDGLTESAAIVNAVQRAVDDVCRSADLAILAPVVPYSISVKLAEPRVLPNAQAPPRSKVDKALARYAALMPRSRAGREEVTCTATAAGGGLAAVCGYKRQFHRGGASEAPNAAMDTGHSGVNTAMGTGSGFSRGVRMYFGSVVHLVDIKEHKEVNALVAEELGSGGIGCRKLVGCAFSDNWRYLCGVSERHVFLWDTQQGRCLDKKALPPRFTPGSAGFIRDGKDGYVVVAARRGRKILGYKVEKH